MKKSNRIAASVLIMVVLILMVAGKYNMERRKDNLFTSLSHLHVESSKNEYKTTAFETMGTHTMLWGSSSLVTTYTLHHGFLSWLGASIGVDIHTKLVGDAKSQINYQAPYLLEGTGHINNAGNINIQSKTAALDILTSYGLVSVAPASIHSYWTQNIFNNEATLPLITGHNVRIEKVNLSQSTNYTRSIPTGEYGFKLGKLEFGPAVVSGVDFSLKDMLGTDYSMQMNFSVDEANIPGLTEKGKLISKFSLTGVDRPAATNLFKLYRSGDAPEDAVQKELRTIFANGVNLNLDEWSMSSQKSKLDASVNYRLVAKTDAVKDSTLTAHLKATGGIADPISKSLGVSDPVDTKIIYKEGHVFVGTKEVAAQSIIKNLMQVNTLLGLE